MFCPNCAAANNNDQHYCRSCGLALDAVAAQLSAQRPSPEYAELLRKRRLFERLGLASASIAGLIAFMLVLSATLFYKLILLGPEVLIGSALGALGLFVLLAGGFYAYSRLVLRVDKGAAAVGVGRPADEVSTPTNKLLNESHFDPTSVTENTTELLEAVRRK